MLEAVDTTLNNLERGYVSQEDGVDIQKQEWGEKGREKEGWGEREREGEWDMEGESEVRKES